MTSYTDGCRILNVDCRICGEIINKTQPIAIIPTTNTMKSRGQGRIELQRHSVIFKCKTFTVQSSMVTSPTIQLHTYMYVIVSHNMCDVASSPQSYIFQVI